MALIKVKGRIKQVSICDFSPAYIIKQADGEYLRIVCDKETIMERAKQFGQDVEIEVEDYNVFKT